MLHNCQIMQVLQT